jgi:uncharacterized membrane protein YkgB
MASVAVSDSAKLSIQPGRQPVGGALVEHGLRRGIVLERTGRGLVQYGLALVIAWIGAMKFTVYEARAIEPLVRNSPLMSWGYALFSVEGFSACLGVAELAIAGLIAAKRVSRLAAALGGLLGAGMFLTTLSFMLSTPGIFEPSAGGFPALSAMPGQFVLKDVVLLGASLWIAGSALVEGQPGNRRQTSVFAGAIRTSGSETSGGSRARRRE